MFTTLKSLFFTRLDLHLLFYSSTVLSIAGGNGYPLCKYDGVSFEYR